jgi:NTP pyrophosphatase (non-canonical NTP hydrolase)
MDEKTTISDLRSRMARFVSRRQWDKYHKPKNLAMSIAIEAAELMEHFQWLTHDEAEQVTTKGDLRFEIASEMADILAYLLSLANALEIDLSQAFVDKMEHNERKYPIDSVLGHYDHSMKHRSERPDRDEK